MRERITRTWYYLAARLARTVSITCLMTPVLLLPLFPVSAQAPAEPSPIARTYTSFSVISEIPGSWADAPEAMVALGRLWTRGPAGRWLLRADGVGGLVAGRYLLDGVFLGPQLSVAPVLTGEYLELTSRSFAEFYPVLGASTYGHWRWRSSLADLPVGFSLVPAVLAGVGFRMYDRGMTEPSLITVDVAYEVRFGPGSPRVLVRIGSHRPRRARS